MHHHHNCSRTGLVAKFAEINPLPCAKRKGSVNNGNDDARASEHSFKVRWHVIKTLGGVRIGRVALWGYAIKPRFKVAPGGRVSVFLNADTSGRVLDKHRARAYLKLALVENVCDACRDFVKTSTVR